MGWRGWEGWLGKGKRWEMGNAGEESYAEGCREQTEETMGTGEGK
jgi:hypothetical protein